MRSMRTRVLIVSALTLCLSVAACVVIARLTALRNIEKEGIFAQMQRLQRDEAVGAYQRGGVPELRMFIRECERYLKGDFFLADASGKDLVTGRDLRAWLPTPEEEQLQEPYRRGDLVIVASSSPTTPYRFLMAIKPPFDYTTLLPYLGVLVVALICLSWTLSMSFVPPLSQLAETLRRFGGGDLSARVRLDRRDEIGTLARSYNEMASRIEELLKAERRLLLDVSHELRTPLARMRFAAALIRDSGDREAAVARMTREIDRLAALVDTLLDVTRDENERALVQSEFIPLHELLAQVVDDCEVEARARHCRLTLASEPAVVRGDGELLRRAVENVVRNAIYYSPAETKVDIGLATRRGEAAITVRDEGPGVPADLLEKIFVPFFRVDDSRTASTGGVGLGLSITKRAIDLHGGRIGAELAEPGLLITITLPVQNVKESVSSI